MGVVDDTWHHVCVTWVAFDRLSDVYKDGERKFQFEGFWSSAVNMGMEGTVAFLIKVLRYPRLLSSPKSMKKKPSSCNSLP